MSQHGPCRIHYDPMIIYSIRRYTDTTNTEITWRDWALAIQFSGEVDHLCLAFIQGQHICPRAMTDLAYTYRDHTYQNLISITCDMHVVMSLDIVSMRHMLHTMANMSSRGIVCMPGSTGPSTETCRMPQ